MEPTVNDPVTLAELDEYYFDLFNEHKSLLFCLGGRVLGEAHGDHPPHDRPGRGELGPVSSSAHSLS